jgi:VanZ family protein
LVRILLIVLLLVAYGSLYPFDFHSRPLAASAPWILLHSWPPGVERTVLADVVLNILIYLPVGFLGSLAWGKKRSLVLAAAFSACIEVLQLFDDSRMCSTLDLVSNIAGGAGGVWLAQVYGKRVARLLAESPVRAALRPTPALLLLGCWIGYQTFPLIPHLRLYPLRMKVSVLLHPAGFSLLPMLSAVFEWLAVARLLEEIRLGAWAFAGLMLLVPARLLIAGRTFTWPELAGAVCAGIIWSWWLAMDEKRSRWLAWMAVAVLLVRGLAPFHWQSSAAAFAWLPFTGFLEANKNSAVTVFFEKSFLYGTAVWFFSRGGYSALLSGLGIAGLLGAIEMTQTHLAGRTPEITDPVYALVLAVMLALLDALDRRARARLMAKSGDLEKCE